MAQSFRCSFPYPFPVHGSVSYAELATAAAVPESQLRSVARMAMTSNLLCESSPGHIAHNPVSTLFVNDSRCIDWITFITRFSAPTAAAFSEATQRWGLTDRKNETAFNVSTKTTLPLFEYFAESTELADCFASYMKAVQSSHGTSLKHLVTGYDWAGLGKAKVVDVGGSTCRCSIALAKAFPSLTFIVEDLPDTISNASKLLATQPDPVSSRISTLSHDFFTPQPVIGASIYLLRMILHDWPRAHALKILFNHLAALKVNANSRMVIMDTVLPPPGTTSPVEEALLRVRDLTMIQSFNSKERELSEFEELFAETKGGQGSLVLLSWKQPSGSVLSVLEVAYQRYSTREVAERAVNGTYGNYGTTGLANL